MKGHAVEVVRIAAFLNIAQLHGPDEDLEGRNSFRSSSRAVLRYNKSKDHLRYFHVRFGMRIFCLERSFYRHSAVLKAALEELLVRRRVIQDAIEATDSRKREAVELSGRFESELLLGRRTSNGAGEAIDAMRRAKLTAMNKILERSCVLRQCLIDIDFLCAVLVRLFNDAEVDGADLDLERIPALARRLAQVGDVLDRLRPLPELDAMNRAIEADRGQRVPARVSLDLSSPLYEKVLCQVPFSLFDSKGRRIQSLSQVDIWYVRNANFLRFA